MQKTNGQNSFQFILVPSYPYLVPVPVGAALAANKRHVLAKSADAVFSKLELASHFASMICFTVPGRRHPGPALERTCEMRCIVITKLLCDLGYLHIS